MFIEEYIRLEAVLKTDHLDARAKEIQIKIAEWLRRHMGNPHFRKLSEQLVRFDGWQAANAGEREVRKALRRTLMKYKLHQDNELFEKAYGYIREYY